MEKNSNAIRWPVECCVCRGDANAWDTLKLWGKFKNVGTLNVRHMETKGLRSYDDRSPAVCVFAVACQQLEPQPGRSHHSGGSSASNDLSRLLVAFIFEKQLWQ